MSGRPRPIQTQDEAVRLLRLAAKHFIPEYEATEAGTRVEAAAEIHRFLATLAEGAPR